MVGVVDGSHIPILPPGESKEDYFNRKHAYCVNRLAVVDINMLFLYASVRYPGSIHDSRVLQLSDIYRKIEHENLAPHREISGFQNKPWRQRFPESKLDNKALSESCSLNTYRTPL